MRAVLVRAEFRLAALALGLVASGLSAQTNSARPQETTPAQPAAKPAAPVEALAIEGFTKPPETLARLVTAPRESNFTFGAPSPGSRKYFLRTLSDGAPGIDLMGKAHYNLAGFQIDYLGNRARSMTTRGNIGFELYDWAGAKSIKIEMPAGSRAGTASFSPDGSTIAFIAQFANSTQIYLADPATGKSRPLTTLGMLATNVTNFEWTADNKSIVAVLVPDGRSPEPKEPPIAPEPMVRMNEGTKLSTSFYPDVLESPYEKTLVEYYTTGQLALIDVKSKAVKKIGAPGMIRTLDASPDGMFFRATYLDKPFSYILPVSSFGTTEVIIDQTGKVLTQLAKRPLRESQPDSAGAGGRGAAGGRGGAGGATPVDTARRNLAWHPFDAGMMYLQMSPLPAGAKADSATLAARHDRLMAWTAPFDGTSSKQLYESPNRINSVNFSDNGKIMFVSETATGAGAGEYAIYADEGGKKYTVIAPAAGGRGGNGGRGAGGGAPPAAAGRGGRGGAGGGASALVTRPGSRGLPVVMISTDGQHVFAQGTTTDTARRAYVDRIDIKTGTKERIYVSTSDVPETIVSALDDDYNKILVSRESAKVIGQSFLVDTKTKEAKQLTANKDLMPEITNAIRKTVIAKRADGKTFKIAVTLPADWKPGTRLPALFWFYPREYESQDAYNRGAGLAVDSIANPAAAAAGRYPTYGPRAMAFITTQGYALIEPDTPIFADNGTPPNDHYVDDLRDDLSATIDALDSLGYIDRTRLGIGGHSYGAFSTANAMVHTPWFKAGIAGDGAYNRTLTPTGFQSEQRSLWQSREVYLNMSPFLYADKLNGALLMYHSMEDQNVGTAPINSIRMFHALQSMGKTTALYMYPYEDHGPVAKETNLDQWARWVGWLDKYVKNAGKPVKATM